MKNFQKAIELCPKDAESILSMGNIFLFQGKYADALLWYDKAAQSNPDDPFCFQNRAAAKKYLGDTVGYQNDMEIYEKLSKQK